MRVRQTLTAHILVLPFAPPPPSESSLKKALSLTRSWHATEDYSQLAADQFYTLAATRSGFDTSFPTWP